MAKKASPEPADAPTGAEGTGTAPETPSVLDGLDVAFLSYVEEGMTRFRARVEADIAAMTRADLPASQLAQLFAALRRANDIVAEATKPLGEASSRMAQVVIPEAFQRENLSSFTTGNGYRVTVTTRLMASIFPDKRDEAYAWLRANNLADLIQPTVSASTLSATGKQMLEEGKELPEDLFRVHLQPNTSLTKTKATK